MKTREQDAIALLRRIYEIDTDERLLGDGMILEWIEREIAVFIREWQPFDAKP